MSGICLPIDAVSGAPSFPAAQNRVAFGALMLGRTDRPLGAVSGIRPGSDPTVTVTATDATVTPFTAILDPETALTVGAYFVAFEANEVVGINAADSTHSRVDRLDVQCPDDPAGASPLAAVIVYTAGVADGANNVPAAPPRSFPLGTISVPAAGGGSPSWTATTVYSVASGGILPCASSADYPANPYVGQTVYNSAIDRLVRWNGTTWSTPGPSGFIGENSDTGSVNVADGNQHAGLGAVTFTLTERRRVRVHVEARYQLGGTGASNGRVTLSAAYTAGSTASDSGTFVGLGGWHSIRADSGINGSGGSVGGTVAGTVVLDAGEYTAHCLVQRLNGAGTGDTCAAFYTLVEDMGAA